MDGETRPLLPQNFNNMGPVILILILLFAVIALVVSAKNSDKMKALEKDCKAIKEENITLGRQVNDFAHKVEDLRIKCKRAFFDCPDATDKDWQEFAKKNGIYE